MREELGELWAPCGIDSEWRRLKAVLLHRPGREIEGTAGDPNGSLMLAAPDPAEIKHQHDALAQAYRSNGVTVHLVDPPVIPPPNQLFAADLMAMTPEGAILGRPASAVRAGEERWVARALGEMGIPILRSVAGEGTFEGADLMWLTPTLALLAQGFRTNTEGAAQVEECLKWMGVGVVRTRLPRGTMHLMGQLRILDEGVAVGWRGRLPQEAGAAVEAAGYTLHFIPDEEEARKGFSLNVVTLGPGRILMPRGNPLTQAFFERLGVECISVPAQELGKAAGSVGCLTGVLERAMG